MTQYTIYNYWQIQCVPMDRCAEIHLRAGGTAPQHPDWARAAGLLERGGEQLPSCTAARLRHVPRATEQRHLHWFHQGKNRPTTSQDLFKTGEEKVFFTDITKHTSTGEDREGVLTDGQRLQSYCYGKSPLEQGKAALPSPARFSMRSRAQPPSPPLGKRGGNGSAPHLFRKHTATRRSPQSACGDLHVTSPAATWHFCYQRRGSK